MKDLNIGIIGAGTMCKAHSEALSIMPIMFYPLNVKPVKKVLCDVSEEEAKVGAEHYGWEESMSDWRALVARKDIDLIDIVTPNHLHREMCVEAAKNGKMIFCEKPLGISAQDSLEIYRAAKAYGVKNAVAFNKRRWPAVVYAKQLIHQGMIGEIISFRGTFMQSFALNETMPLTWKFQKEKTGGGAIMDIGSHAIDLGRYFAGDFMEVCSVMQTTIKERPLPSGNGTLFGSVINENAGKGKVEVDDMAVFIARFKSGAVGNFEISRVASGKGDGCGFEIWGTKGAVRWNQQMMNEIQISLEADEGDKRGFKIIEIGGKHPYGNALWNVAGFGIGLADNKALELHDVIDAFTNDKPFAADFYDGFKVSQVVEAVQQSDVSHAWVRIPEVNR